MRLVQTLFLVLLPVMVFFSFLVAKNGTQIFTADGYAIHGFDAVAYFKKNKAVEGKTNFAFEWKGSTWLFSSIENLNNFVDDPERYAPQYNGYCAYAAASGYVAPTDPDAFTVFEDKLYLNYSTSIMQRWQLRKEKYISDADGNWSEIQAKLK